MNTKPRYLLKRAFGALAVATMAMTGSVALATPAQAVYTDPSYAFFFTPHQDDEVLSMGTAIKAMTDVGRPVFVVLLTDGGSSQYCTRYNAPLNWTTRAQCVAGRDAEFTAGVKSMGAIPIIRSDRMVDGTLTAAYAKYVIGQYHANYPNAALRTMSQYDGSPDHANLGLGLYQMNLYSLSQWYIKQSERSGRVGAWTAQYDQDATLDNYQFGKISVPGDFSVAYTSGGGNLGYFYTH